MFFQEDQRFLKDFSGQRKNYRISRTKQKKCQGFAASVQKKWNVKQFEETKKQTHRGERKKKVFSQTFILYNKAGVLKPTSVTELEQYVNVSFSIYNILWKSDKNPKNFTENNNKISFGWKITTPAKKSSH